MSKIVPILFTAVGASAISVGGVYLSKIGNGEKDNATSQPKTESDALSIENVQAFEEIDDVSPYTCLNNYFSGLKIKSSKGTARNIDSTNPPSDKFFQSDTSGTTDYQSCLFIQWKKTTYGNNGEGNGKFTGLWTFVKGDEGFINFNVSETAKDKLKLTGVFYLVGRKDSSSDGEIKFKKNVEGTQEAQSSTLDSYFPKVHADLKSHAEGDYGKFFDDSNSLSKICEENCTSGGKSSSSYKKEFIFQKQNGVDKKLKDWCEKLDWGSTLYGNDWSLQAKIENFSGVGGKASS